MKNYLDLVGQIFSGARWRQNRTGIPTASQYGARLSFDLTEGFPAVTTRKLAFKSGCGELVGFLRRSKSAAMFRELGCKFWDQNANENEQWLNSPYRTGHDDLGVIYGEQWRNWPAWKEIDSQNVRALDDARAKGFVEVARRQDEGCEKVIFHKKIDQVRECLDAIINNPSSRRILFHAWNPAVLDEMALPPCHLLYQFHADEASRELSLTLYLRSNDLALGNPQNVHQAAIMLSLFARLTGYTAKHLNLMIGDAHLYSNHVDMIAEQLTREPKARPRLKISERIPAFNETGIYEPQWLDLVTPSDFTLEGYEHHPALTAPMAV